MPDPQVRGRVGPPPPSATSGAGQPGARRRRGAELRAAIHAAALEELRQRGFVDLTMDSIAARARTGKATLYRYWPNKLELVVDALNASPDSFAPPPDTGDLRTQLLAVMRYVADELDSPTGLAARSLISELIRSPELAGAVRTHLADPAPVWVLEVLRRAAVHGHVPAAALTPRVAGVGPDIVRAHAIIHGTPVPDSVLSEIVDAVLVPLLDGYAPHPG
jgi:AcrR family transcriptional regulator